MREIVDKRKLHSKTYDLGGGKRRLEVGRQPLHYDDGTGRLVDIDLTPRQDRGHLLVDHAPFALRIQEREPRYLYTSRTGRYVEVTLIAPEAVKPVVGDTVWGIGPNASYTLRPTPRGCLALLHLLNATAPRVWEWRIIGDRGLLAPITGTDARGQRLELLTTWTGDVLRIEWTGRATSQARLRRRGKEPVWTEDIAYPVAVDPTVNENIAAGGDDVYSMWNPAGTVFYDFNTNNAQIYATAVTFAKGYGGLRFQSIAIPSGATITSATLTVRGTGSTSPNVNLYGNDVDDAAAWANPGNRVKNITKTTAVTNISSFNASADNNLNVTTIIAEILGRGGWASNNDVAFGFFPASGGIKFAALEHATLTEARLSIDYTTVTHYTMVASEGSFSLTGQVASFPLTRAVIGGAGSINLTGVDAVLSVQRDLACEVGSHILSGQDASFLKTIPISVDAASFDLTGYAAGLIADRILVGSLGEFIFTGNDAGLAIAISPISGEFILTGNDASITAIRYLGGSAGEFILTGNNASLSLVIPASSASFLLTGNDASMIFTRLIGSGVGSFVLTGISAQVFRNIPLIAGSGSFIFRGVAAKLSWSGATAQSFETFLVKPPNAKMVNPNTGALNHEWDVYFKSLTDRLNALNPNMLER